MPKPTTDAEWARDVERRLAALERSQTVRVGAWSLSEDRDGRLVGVNSRTGARVVIEP